MSARCSASLAFLDKPSFADTAAFSSASSYNIISTIQHADSKLTFQIEIHNSETLENPRIGQRESLAESHHVQHDCHLCFQKFHVTFHQELCPV